MNPTQKTEQLNQLRVAVSVAQEKFRAEKITAFDLQAIEDKYQNLKFEMQKEIDNGKEL